MRFPLDENVPLALGDYLTAQGYDVLAVRRSPLSSSSDTVVWAVAVKERRVIITHDKDFPLPGALGTPPAVIL